MKGARRFVILLFLSTLLEPGPGQLGASVGSVDRRVSLVLEDEYWTALQRRATGARNLVEFAEIDYRLSERPLCLSWIESDTIRQVFVRSSGAGFALAELHAEIHEFEAESGRLILPGRRLATWRTALDSGDVELQSSEQRQLLVDAVIALTAAAAKVRLTPVLVESKHLLDRALLLGGEDADVLSGLAHLSELTGERRHATAYFDRLSRLRPGDRWAAYGARRGSSRNRYQAESRGEANAKTAWIEALEIQDGALEAYRRGDPEAAVRLASLGARDFPSDSTFEAICALASLTLRTRDETCPQAEVARGVPPGARVRFDLEAARRLWRRRESFRSRASSQMEDLAIVIDRMRSQPDEVRPVAPICDGLRIPAPLEQNRRR